MLETVVEHSVTKKRLRFVIVKFTKMEIINNLFGIYLSYIENKMTQTTLSVQNQFRTQRRKLREEILQHLLCTTPPNCLLDLGPILRFSGEKQM